MGADSATGKGEVAEVDRRGGISVDLVRSWGYEEKAEAVLLELQKAAAYAGPASVSWQLLDFVGRRRPRLHWSERIDRLGFAGLTLALPWGYAILLNPRHVGPHPLGASTLAHELGHALWNSHGFTSLEEEYYCERLAGRAHLEMLLAHGIAPDEAEQEARSLHRPLRATLSEWIAEHRRGRRRHLLRPWTWFDRRRTADVVGNLLSLGLVNLGILGHPAWYTRRDLARR